MNDKDRELVQQILHAAGTAGEQGFGYLIRWIIWDGIVSAITCTAIVAGAIYLLRMAFKWKPKEGFDEDLVHIIRGVAIVILCGIIIGFMCGISDNIVQILSPEGAAIHSALHK